MIPLTRETVAECPTDRPMTQNLFEQGLKKAWHMFVANNKNKIKIELR